MMMDNAEGKFYVAKIKCYAAGDEQRMGGVFVWCGDNEREWERQTDMTDGGLPMSWDDALEMVSRLDSEQYCMSHGEFGRPDYYMIDERTHDWLREPFDSGKYDFPERKMSDDEIADWTLNCDEDYVRENAVKIDVPTMIWGQMRAKARKR